MKMFINWKSDQKKLRIMEDTDHSQFRNDCDIDAAIKFIERTGENNKRKSLQQIPTGN